MHPEAGTAPKVSTGWTSCLSVTAIGATAALIVSGLILTFAPFHPVVQWNLIIHTVLGSAALAPIAWYLWKHWADYRGQAVSDVVLLGYAATGALLVCLVSGVVVTAQALFGVKTSAVWRAVHLYSTYATLAACLPHIVLGWMRGRSRTPLRSPGLMAKTAAAMTVASVALAVALAAAYNGTGYDNRFPDDYQYVYGKQRPFAPSLATTSTGGAFDRRSLAGSESCGTAGCHSQILNEWKPSAHRYAAMDKVFQGIQNAMAKQNGPESTRYCAGCHDPISLFSGSKNIFTDNLTNAEGYHEGVSCLSCHAIQQTDLRGNANYVIHQPSQYLWQWASTGAGRVARDFLIRAYPVEHNRLSKRMYKAPEYCAACHKQFIDQEVNRVGWVQLQNQYDNWKASHWNRKGDATKTVECRECHMPLVASNDPASGDSADYNRKPDDGKHRSHRFLASNNFMPGYLKIEGHEEQVKLTEQWLKGQYAIPEIKDKWANGDVVKVAIEAPDSVSAGDKIPIRIHLAANKVGHDYPTGPLDLIQSWVEIEVKDDQGNVVFASGRRDEKNFIEPGSFLFKAEPVDQHGNLIDRHNLWEMVGVRYRRSLFPGYADTVEYTAVCPSPTSGKRAPEEQRFEAKAPGGASRLTVTATLNYRKVDQFLLNYLLGEGAATAPVVKMVKAEATIQVAKRGKS